MSDKGQRKLYLPFHLQRSGLLPLHLRRLPNPLVRHNGGPGGWGVCVGAAVILHSVVGEREDTAFVGLCQTWIRNPRIRRLKRKWRSKTLTEEANEDMRNHSHV